MPCFLNLRGVDVIEIIFEDDILNQRIEQNIWIAKKDINDILSFNRPWFNDDRKEWYVFKDDVHFWFIDNNIKYFLFNVSVWETGIRFENTKDAMLFKLTWM